MQIHMASTRTQVGIPAQRARANSLHELAYTVRLALYRRYERVYMYVYMYTHTHTHTHAR